MNMSIVNSVRSGLDDVISKHFSSPPKIEINQGAATGDGYSSNSYSINLKEPGRNLGLFVKYLPNNTYPSNVLALFSAMFSNEHKFYGEIYPAMMKFQEDHGVDHPFTNIPKYFPITFVDGHVPPVFLENIKLKGYQLRDRKRPIDEQHIVLVITTQARFHAVSFAMKDQNPDIFKKLCHGLSDLLSQTFKGLGMDALVYHALQELKESIHPVTDKKIFDHLENLAENLVLHCSTLDKKVDQYAVITQGDSWSNNMMFLYDSSTRNPIEIKLIDWQLLRLNSPVLDVAYFLYTVANKEVLNNFDSYMKLYYETLTNQIEALGSDPAVLYPESIFKQHWKKLAKFGFAMSFMVVKALLFEEDEVPKLVDGENINPIIFSVKIKRQDVYTQIIKDILEHLIDKDFL